MRQEVLAGHHQRLGFSLAGSPFIVDLRVVEPALVLKVVGFDLGFLRLADLREVLGLLLVLLNCPLHHVLLP